MNAASLANSARLRRVAELLADRAEHSTLDIVDRARVCAVNSIVGELRENGWVIDCTQRVVNGDRRWFYRAMFVPPAPYKPMRVAARAAA